LSPDGPGQHDGANAEEEANSEAAPEKDDPTNAVPESDTPDVDLLGNFANNYEFGDRLEIRRGADGKKRIQPSLQKDKFYFVSGWDPPTVIRIRDIEKKSMLVLDTRRSCEVTVDTGELMRLIRRKVWTLVPKGSKSS
ncbi:MAG: hypothetical protein AAF989_07255, partial [Planctomycetota bacterium]